MAIHSGILACRIPRTEEPGGPQSTESQRVGHNRSDLARTQNERYNGLKSKFSESLPLALIPYPLEDRSKEGAAHARPLQLRSLRTPVPAVPPHTWAVGPETGLGTQTHQNWLL